MDYEQKYKEALERAKEVYNSYKLFGQYTFMNEFETIFPELSESEDERIRKDIVAHYRLMKEKALLDNQEETDGIVRTCDSALAWLEKQKETSINWMKSDNVKNPEKPYIDKVGMFYTTDGRMCYASEIEKQRDENAKDSFERGIKVGMIRQQKKQKPIKWTDLTWKDIVELEGIINNVHYDFSAGIGQESFGKEVLERFRSTKGIEYLDEAEQKCWREEEQKEQKPTECERQPEFREVEYDFRGEKVKVMRPFFRDDKGKEFSTTGRDTDLTWSVLREWCENKGIEPYDLYPRAKWSEEDEEMLTMILGDLEWERRKTTVNKDISLYDEKMRWLKSLPKMLKKKNDDVKKLCSNEWSEEDARMMESIIRVLVKTSTHYSMRSPSTMQVTTINDYQREIAWLKSLRPSWKPSEEQLGALLAVINEPNNMGSATCFGLIDSLYEDLKKLKEE